VKALLGGHDFSRAVAVAKYEALAAAVPLLELAQTVEAERERNMTLPILPTTVVGSYSMPGWLERLKTEYFARRISRQDLDEIHDTAVKAAIKDQEVAGLDIITDGELRRDNMIDYFVERMAGVQFDRSAKKFYYDFYDSEVIAKLPATPLGLGDDFRFLRANTTLETKVCITGPHSLAKRIRNKHYPTEEAFAMDIARTLNVELKELVKAGARLIQIDEPYISGFPEDLDWEVQAVNALVDGVSAKWRCIFVTGIATVNRRGKVATATCFHAFSMREYSS
jgi:5-methyltetrahydropteroyltriglutamate--homocysteine methyltransferase